MWCKEEKTGNPFPESHFSPGQTGGIHNPAERQNNYTRQDKPDALHSRTIGRFLYFPQDYHRGKSACHSEANVNCYVGAKLVPRVGMHRRHVLKVSVI
jgi:hypothetical protein